MVRGRGQRRDPRGAGGHAHHPRLQRRGASDPRLQGIFRPPEGQRRRGHQGDVLHAPPLGCDDELPDHGDLLGRGGRHRPGLREHRGADGAVLGHDSVHVLRHPGALRGDDDHRDPPAAAQRHGVLQEDRGRHLPRISREGRGPRGVRRHRAWRGEVRARQLHLSGDRRRGPPRRIVHCTQRWNAGHHRSDGQREVHRRLVDGEALRRHLRTRVRRRTRCAGLPRGRAELHDRLRAPDRGRILRLPAGQRTLRRRGAHRGAGGARPAHSQAR